MVKTAVEGSLKRLGTDHIDLLPLTADSCSRLSQCSGTSTD